MSSQIHTNDGKAASYTDDGVQVDGNVEASEENAPGTDGPEENIGMNKADLGELAATAEQFNVAFNTALYELESSRKLIRERTARIDELNEAINVARNQLEAETRESRRKEEEYAREKDLLNNSLNELKSTHEATCSERESLQSALEGRNGELHSLQGELEGRNNELNSLQGELEGRNNELNSLKGELEGRNNELNSLRGDLEGRNNELRSLQEELEARTGELASFSERVNELSAEIASLKEAGEQREASHREEADRLGNEIRQLNESLNERESQFKLREEELLAYTDKIQALNRNLHETAISENDMHARALEEKDREIAALHGKLESTDGMPSAGDDTAQMQSALQELESRFRESEDRCQVLGERASAADELEAEVTRLSASLQEAKRPGDEAERLNSALQETERLEAEVARLGTALQEAERPGDEGERLNSALQETERLEAEVARLGTALQEAERPGDEGERLEEAVQEVDRLKTEIERLNAALDETRIAAAQDNTSSEEVSALRQQLADLESALDSTRAERDALKEKLDNHTAQDQEIAVLTQAVEHSENSANVQVLNNEIEILKAALAAAEEKCESLEAGSPDMKSSSAGPEPSPTATTMSLEPVEQPGETKDRDGFLELLNKQLQEPGEEKTSSTIMYVLVDNFVRVRDEIGIMNSEKVMTEIAGIINSSCDGSIVARFGDCTFAVLGNDENQDETRGKAEKIRTTLENHIFEVLGQSLVTTASIGICTVRENDKDGEKVVARADVACESARTSGGNQVVVSSAVADDIDFKGNNEGHVEIVSKVLSESRIKIYYQPISSLVNKESHCYEVLTRIVDEDGNIILPGEFFSMAINSGKAMDVDLHIIENIMRMMSSNSGQPMTLFLKLTRQTIASQDFAVWLMEKIREYQINPEQLVFEVSENLLQNELKSLSMLSKALASIGCKMAIEHYRMDTQPQHLQHIQADYLKIDSGLVQNIGNKGKCFTKVTDIVEVARNNNFIVVAEGVESPASLAILWELGVSLAQGYFIQAPAGDMQSGDTLADADTEEEDSDKATYTLG